MNLKTHFKKACLIYVLLLLCPTLIYAQTGGSWLGVGDVNLSNVTTDADNTDGVGDGAIFVDGQSAVVGQGIVYQFTTPLVNGQSYNLNTYTYNQNASYVKFNVQLYNLTDNTVLATQSVTISNSSSPPVNTILNYTGQGSDAGDILQLRYIRTDNGNTARNFAIDNAKLNGTFISTVLVAPMSPTGIWSPVGSVTLSMITSDADNGDGVADGAILADASTNGLPEGATFQFQETMLTNQPLALQTVTYNTRSSYVRFDVELYNVTDAVVLATQQVFHSGGDITPVTTTLNYTAQSSDDGDVLQLRYLRVDNGNPARDFSIDNASINGNFLPALGGGTCPLVVTPDLPLNGSNATIEAEIDTIMMRYSDDILGTSAPTTSSLNAAIASYNSYSVIVSGGSISGNTIAKWDDLSFIQVFAAHLKFNPTDITVEEMARNTIWLAGRQFCDGTLDLGHNGYEYKYFGRGAIFLQDILTPEIEDLFEYSLFKRQLDFDNFWLATYDHAYQMSNDAIDTDWIFNLSDILMGYASWQATADERYRYMVAMKRYMDRFFSYSYGTTNGIKKDGTGFHHWTAYNNYMYAYKTAANVVHYLNNSQFQVDETNYKVFRDAVMAQYIMSNDAGVQALSTCGRNPHIRSNQLNATSLKRLAISGGQILGLSTADPELAGFYNRLYGVDVDFNYSTVGTFKEGFYQFNHGHGSSYRKNNWVAFNKGFSTNMWGAEIYTDRNRYGRYQSYGALEIIYPGNLSANGYDVETWDWNYNPGATSIVLPWASLHAERGRIDELQQKRFIGSLTHNNQGSQVLNNNHGVYGMFGMDFQEKEGQGFGTVHSSEQHNNTFAFKKSSFYFGDMIVCLGSGISNDDGSNPTVTTLYQREYSPGIEVVVNNSTQSGTGTTTYSGSSNNWLISNLGTGFYLLQGNDDLKIKKASQQTPNHDQTNPANYVNNPIATYCVGYIDHGTTPSSEEYEYIIMPGAGTIQMLNLDTSINNGNKPYIVHQKDQNAHIVEYKTDDVWGYSFFGPENGLNYGHLKEVDGSCLLMHHYDTTNHTIIISLDNPDVGFESRAYTASVAKTIEVTLHGEWHLPIAHPSVSVVSADTVSTVLSFNTIDGLAIEVVFAKGNVNCPLGQVNTACDDGDPCTVLDSYDSECNCVGVPIVADTVFISETTCDINQVGTSIQNLTNGNGCDSIVTTITTLLSSDAVTINAISCNPVDTGTVVQNLTNGDGCDSIVTTITTLLASDAVTINATSCNPIDTGTVVQNLTNGDGCDSIVTTITTLLASNAEALNLTSCDPTKVGTVIDTFTNLEGCDSIVTFITTLLPSQADTVSVLTCDAEDVGTSTDSFLNIYGCDSTITTITTLGSGTMDSVTVSAESCDSSDLGTSVVILTNQDGCDSIVTTITTLLQSDAVLFITETCDTSQVGVFIDSFTNTYGCDSIITTMTSMHKTYDTSNVYSCDPIPGTTDVFISAGIMEEVYLFELTPAFALDTIGDPQTVNPYNGLAFNMVDGFNYALALDSLGATYQVVKVGTDGFVENLGTPTYDGFPVTFDMKVSGVMDFKDNLFLYGENSGAAIGAPANNDLIFQMDVTTLNIDTIYDFGDLNKGSINDIACNFKDNKLYGVSSTNWLHVFDLNSTTVDTSYVEYIHFEREKGGAWVDPYGDFYVLDEAGPIYRIDTINTDELRTGERRTGNKLGAVKIGTTSPVTNSDATNSLSLQLSTTVSPASISPGDTVTYTYNIYNPFNSVLTVSFNEDMRTVDDFIGDVIDQSLTPINGTYIPSTLSGTSGGTASFTNADQELTITTMTLSANGTYTFSIDVVTPGSLTPATYYNQSRMYNVSSTDFTTAARLNILADAANDALNRNPVGLDVNGGLLPVELLTFDVIEDNGDAMLNWVTGSEVNNEYWDILRSTDGMNWISIGQTAGMRTTDDITRYHFRDDRVAENITYYYRLQQFDFDGSHEYSDIETFRLNKGAVLGQFNVFPNPVFIKGQLNISVEECNDCQLKIYNTNGVFVMQQAVEERIIVLDLSSLYLVQGIYIIELSNSSGFQREKIIVN